MSDKIEINTDMEDFDLSEVDFVDFTDVKPRESLIKSSKPKYDKVYNDYTMETMKTHRRLKTCPIGKDKIDKSYAFVVKNMWDPIAGEFLDKKDPFGSLYYNPLELAMHFYLNRLNYLWKEEIDEGAHGGYYEGYYDMALGCGDNFEITGRGEYPEYYIWRIPDTFCYMEKGLKPSIPTKGPKLSRDDVVKIWKLCKKCPKEKMEESAFASVPDLPKMYDLYNQAISKDPDTSKVVLKPDEVGNVDIKYKANMLAVNALREM
jgi:hypothetical protein